jgi:hypothetical protein
MEPQTNVTTLHVDVEQLAALDQCRYNRDEVNSDEYAPTRAILETEGNLPVPAWTNRVDPLLDRLEAAWGGRSRSQGVQTREATSIRVRVSDAMKWFAELDGALNQAARLGVQAAQELLPEVASVAPSADNFRHVHPSLQTACQILAEQPDLAVLGLRPDFIQRGLDLRRALGGDRTQLVGAQAGITENAGDLHRALVELAALMEQLNDARELAMIRIGRELPGFDLRLVRAAIAPRRTPTANAEPAPATGM